MGTIYLLHFDKPYKHTRHYLGYTDNLEKRLDKHRRGEGARLLRVISNLGIGFTLVRTWKGNRKKERELKNKKNTPKLLCPICRGEITIEEIKNVL